jgi:membrane-associated protease RseP (regulator of RpoE activity)
MEIQAFFALAFIILLGIVIYIERKKLILQKVLFPFLYIFMYRTKIGLNAMDRLAKKFPRLLKYAGYSFIVLGYAGMVFISYKLVENLYLMYVSEKAVPGVGILQPFSQNLPGTIYVPFFYFIISLFVVVVIHEFSHGVLARVHKLKVTSSGVGVIGIIAPIIPIAFVEPDEKEMRKRPAKQQLSVIAAGPLSNIVLGFLIIGFFLAIAMPIDAAVLDHTGVSVHGLVEEGNYPVQDSGLTKGEVITEMDGVEVLRVKDFSAVMEGKNPGDTLNIVTNKTAYDIELGVHPTNTSKPYLGVFVADKTEIKESFKAQYGAFVPAAIMWGMGLLFWLYLINLGIGFFNLLPIAICDGGRMFQIALLKIFGKKNEKLAHKIWGWVGIAFILVLVMIIFKSCTG